MWPDRPRQLEATQDERYRAEQGEHGHDDAFRGRNGGGLSRYQPDRRRFVIMSRCPAESDAGSSSLDTPVTARQVLQPANRWNPPRADQP